MLDNYLIHYASKYYDPLKASEYNHQYYEAHKELKGRKAGKQLNEAGQIALYTVTNAINEEQKRQVAKAIADRDKAIEEIQNEIQNLHSLGKQERDKK